MNALNRLDPAQRQRAAGVALGLASGDALGAGYEFGPPLPHETAVGMIGGNGFAPHEWTDDTSMTWPILRAAAAGKDLRDQDALQAVADGWWAWASSDPTDIGIHTSAVLRTAARGGAPTPEGLRAAATARHHLVGKSAGNGSLMRTAPIAVAYLNDPRGLVEASQLISDLTHHDEDAGQACVLWGLAIRHAVLTGELDLRAGLKHLPTDRVQVWADRIDQAESRTPASYTHNGWVVETLQAAWSAIRGTPVPADDPAVGSHPAAHLRLALEAAVRGGRDTDTVAAVAGGLLGAAWGASAVPAAWRRELHGWGGTARDLLRLAVLASNAGQPDGQGWPLAPVVDYVTGPEADVVVAHPDDPGVLLGGVRGLHRLPDEVTAVVSLCRLGAAEHPAPGITPANHLEVWLIDSPARDANPHLDFVLADTVHALTALRSEGHIVYLHCVEARSRTPTIAALYGTRVTGDHPAEALARVARSLPAADPNPAFREALVRAGT